MKTTPEICNFKINAEGVWFHDGAPIQRAALVKLFADKGLKVDENGYYWLASPYEKYPVDVEDVPFLIVDYTIGSDGISFITNLDETIALGPEHPLELRQYQKAGFDLPYIHVRAGLYARINRATYYRLVEAFGSVLESRGERYPLGRT